MKRFSTAGNIRLSRCDTASAPGFPAASEPDAPLAHPGCFRHNTRHRITELAKNNQSHAENLAFRFLDCCQSARSALARHHRSASRRADQRVVAGGRCLCTYAVAYRFYSKFIAAKVLALGSRSAPLLPSVSTMAATSSPPTNGSCSATTSPPLPAPGRWSVPCSPRNLAICPAHCGSSAGAVLGGCVQDFVILLFSVAAGWQVAHRNGEEEIGPRRRIRGLRRGPEHHRHSARGHGADRSECAEGESLGNVHDRDDHAHRAADGRVSAPHPAGKSAGNFCARVCAGDAGRIWGGQWVSQSPTLGTMFTLTAPTLAIVIIVLRIRRSALPVWLLLAPRDYLSTFVKLGTIAHAGGVGHRAPCGRRCTCRR